MLAREIYAESSADASRSIGTGMSQRQTRASAQSVWNTSSAMAHQSPSLREASGACIGL
jgi:hypothetical protein